MSLLFLITGVCSCLTVAAVFFFSKSTIGKKTKTIDVGKETQTIDDDLDEKLEGLKRSMGDLPKDMRPFFSAIRDLYYDDLKAVHGDSDVSRNVQKLRDDTRNNAIVYLKVVLPLTKEYVSQIRVFFENYITLTYDEWYKKLPDNLQKARLYREFARIIVEEHEELRETMIRRKKEAKDMIGNCQLTQMKLDHEKKELEKKGEGKQKWANVLNLFPGLNHITEWILELQAHTDSVNAVAKKEKANEQAVFVVNNTLIPALDNFICGLATTAGFFKCIEERLITFKNRTEAGIEDGKELMYRMMANAAKNMTSLCDDVFYAVPDVRSDFNDIPKCVEERLKVIRKKIKLPELAENILEAVRI